MALGTVYRIVLPRRGWNRVHSVQPEAGRPKDSLARKAQPGNPWRWPAAQRRKGMTTGPCGCWRARWWSWGSPCPTRRCACGSKKPPQAVAEKGVVHSQGERRLRGHHGGGAGPDAEPHDPQRPVVCFDETSTHAERCATVDAGPSRDCRGGRTTSTGGRGPATCSWPASRWRGGAVWQ